MGIFESLGDTLYNNIDRIFEGVPFDDDEEKLLDDERYEIYKHGENFYDEARGRILELEKDGKITIAFRDSLLEELEENMPQYNKWF